ncbi:MAG: hypothetical protein ABI983_04850 [Acidobacteriota bacterium]
MGFKRWLLAVLVVTIAGVSARPAAQTSDAAALAQFNDAIARYLAMRQSLVVEKIPGPVPNSTAPEVNRAADALAAAIQRARSKARPGDVFGPAVTQMFKRRIEDAIRSANLGPVLSNIDDEGPATTTPALHLRFPAAAALATMPPSLLEVLPPLPKPLEYRIVGQYLVLRDVEAGMIIDFIPAAVPR